MSFIVYDLSRIFDILECFLVHPVFNGFNVDFTEDKVISMAGSTKPIVNILLSALPFYVLLDAR